MEKLLVEKLLYALFSRVGGECKDAPYAPYIAPVSRRGISSVIGPFGAVAKCGAFSFLALR